MAEVFSPKLNSLPRDLRAWTRTLVTQQHLRAGERMGQHFLVDRQLLLDILRAANIDMAVPVLEVGGGLGVLTLALLEQGCRVTVVELDSRLATGLRKLAAVSPKLTVHEGDVLKLTDAVLGLASDKFNIVANLPYEISGAFLRRFLGDGARPGSITLLLQREVGERLVAHPGRTSLLSLTAELACRRRELVRVVASNSFWPQPRVTSCLVHLELANDDERAAKLAGEPEERIWRLARIGFAARRKLLKNNLASALPVTPADITSALTKAKLPVNSRAQELALADWVRLSRELAQLSSS